MQMEEAAIFSSRLDALMYPDYCVYVAAQSLSCVSAQSLQPSSLKQAGCGHLLILLDSFLLSITVSALVF